MKKLLSVVLVSVLLIGCSENRVLLDELTDKGTKYSYLMYYEGVLFNGIGYDVYTNGQLKKEIIFKDGKIDGLRESWDKNGQLKYEGNYIDGKKDGLHKRWRDGELWWTKNYKNGKLDGTSNGYYEGKILTKKTYIDGKRID